jgi:hypothetical protein
MRSRNPRSIFGRPARFRDFQRHLIGGLSVLAMIVGVTAANAQANINPNLYPGNTSERYGATAPWEWHAGPGPVKRGGNCVADVDINRGYGFMKPCPAPQASAAPRHHMRVAHRKMVHR